MAASGRQNRSCRIDAWSPNRSFVDDRLERKTDAPNLAHTGDTGIERRRGVCCSTRYQRIGIGCCHVLEIWDQRPDEVAVGLPHSGHDCGHVRYRVLGIRRGSPGSSSRVEDVVAVEDYQAVRDRFPPAWNQSVCSNPERHVISFVGR